MKLWLKNNAGLIWVVISLFICEIPHTDWRYWTIGIIYIILDVWKEHGVNYD